MTRYEYDAGGRLTAVVENYILNGPVDKETNVRTSFGYDNNGNLTTSTDARNNVTTQVYDSLDQRTRITDPLSFTHIFTYTLRGELDKSRDALGRVTDCSYDNGGRLITLDYPSGTPDVVYQYDKASNVLTMTDGLGATYYGYDPLNRMQTRTRDGRAVSYTYANTGEIDAINYWGTGVVDPTIDALGRVDTLNPWGAGLTDYTSTPDGRVDLITRPNRVTSDYGYDAVQRITDIHHSRAGTTRDRFRVTLNSYGNRTAVSQIVGGAVLTSTYRYDKLQRLDQAAYPALPSGPNANTATYLLDRVGNRLNDGSQGANTSYDAGDRVTNNPAFSYDANGNLLSDGTTTYSYDTANRLVQTITNGITTAYAYDGWGTLIRERVTQAGATSTTDYVLDEQPELPRILAELRSDGTEVQYAYGPEGVTAQRTRVGGMAQGVLYPLLDAQASLRHLSDGAGTLVRSVTYDAWGQVRQQSGTAWSRLGYTGEPMGTHDGTVYLRARHYQPALGRFLQRDSFPGIPTRPQSLHKYIYAENNPATFTDPSGKFIFIPVFLAVWAVAEVAIQIYDTYDTVKTLADPCVSSEEKWLTLGLYVAGAFLPGGGYGTGGKAVLHHADDVVRRADEAYNFVRYTADDVVDSTDDVVRRADDAAEEIRVGDVCFNSFSAATPVSTADGLRPISHIRIGDMVWAYDEATNRTGLYTVTDTISHIDPGLIRLTLAGEQIETTAEHPFFVLGRGWVQAEDLILGDRVRQIDGEFGVVEAIQLERHTLRMYNLTVAVAHTFFVGEEAWLVHNTKCDDFWLSGYNVKVYDNVPTRGGPQWGAVTSFKRDGSIKQIGLFDEHGDVIVHIDAPDASTPAWHYHEFPAGSPRGGHGREAPHTLIDNLGEFLRQRGFPDDWDIAP